MEITNLGQLVDVVTIKPPGYKDRVVIFGKYKDRKLSEIPEYYINWAIKQSIPPTTVTCGKCNTSFTSDELPSVNITGIHSVDHPGTRYGADCLEFKCPKCGKDTESLVMKG